MTPTRSLPVQSEDASPPKPARLGLSWTQIAAAGAASITATVILSFFSISGTLIGAAVFSMASAIGNAVYGQSLRKTQDRVLDVLPVGKADPASPTVVLPATGDEELGPDEAPALPAAAPAGPLPRQAWKRIALFAVVLFAFVMAVVTTVELVAGRPLTDVLRGEQGTGTSLGGGGRAPAPTVTVTVTPTVVMITPTITQTASPTVTTTTPAPTTTAPSSSAATTAPATPSDTGTATTATPSPSQTSPR